MKKLLIIMLAMMFVLSTVVACGGTDSDKNDKPATPQEQTTVYLEDASEPDKDSAGETGEPVVIADELSGDWYSLKTMERAVFAPDGSFLYYEDNTGYNTPGKWELSGSTITLSWQLEGDWSVENNDGLISMKKEDDALLRWENLPFTELTLGTAANDGMVEFSIDDVSFTNTVVPMSEMEDLYISSLEHTLSKYPLEEGMTYARIACTVTNNGKSAIEVGDIHRKANLFLDYKDGFIYATNGENISIFTSGNDYIVVTDGTDGNDITVQPLQTKKFLVYVMCPEVIANDNESPLKVAYITQYNGDAQYFIYDVR